MENKTNYYRNNPLTNMVIEYKDKIEIQQLLLENQMNYLYEKMYLYKPEILRNFINEYFDYVQKTKCCSVLDYLKKQRSIENCGILSTISNMPVIESDKIIKLIYEIINIKEELVNLNAYHNYFKQELVNNISNLQNKIQISDAQIVQLNNNIDEITSKIMNTLINKGISDIMITKTMNSLDTILACEEAIMQYNINPNSNNELLQILKDNELCFLYDASIIQHMQNIIKYKQKIEQLKKSVQQDKNRLEQLQVK